MRSILSDFFVRNLKTGILIHYKNIQGHEDFLPSNSLRGIYLVEIISCLLISKSSEITVSVVYSLNHYLFTAFHQKRLVIIHGFNID